MEELLEKNLVMILLLVMFFSPAISQEKTSYGINGGVGVWRMMSLKETGTIIRHESPISYIVGFSVEKPLFDHFSIVSELLYQNSATTVIIDPGFGELNEKVVMKQLMVPILMKYQVPSLGNSYFLLGPSVGYLINAHYEYAFEFESPYEGSAEITKDLPTIQIALEFGVGKEIQISCADLNLELRGQWGFTTFRYKRIDYNDPPDIGRWKNAGIKLAIGYKLN
jgi:hypothetical protein